VKRRKCCWDGRIEKVVVWSERADKFDTYGVEMREQLALKMRKKTQ